MTDELFEWEQSLHGDAHDDRESFPLDELYQDDDEDGEREGRR